MKHLKTQYVWIKIRQMMYKPVKPGKTSLTRMHRDHSICLPHVATRNPANPLMVTPKKMTVYFKVLALFSASLRFCSSSLAFSSWAVEDNGEVGASAAGLTDLRSSSLMPVPWTEPRMLVLVAGGCSLKYRIALHPNSIDGDCNVTQGNDGVMVDDYSSMINFPITHSK